MLKGSIATDDKGKPLQPGQTLNPNQPVENFDKPEGDATTQRKELEKLAEDTGTIVQERNHPDGYAGLVELPTGQTAFAYPNARSGGPSTQISLRGTKKVIKIRYKKGVSRQATILVPTT